MRGRPMCHHWIPASAGMTNNTTVRLFGFHSIGQLHTTGKSLNASAAVPGALIAITSNGGGA